MIEGINMNDIITSIEKLEPRPTEAIVLTFDANNIKVEEIVAYSEALKRKFPANKIICLPSSMSLNVFSKNTLENWIAMVSKVIEEL